MLKLPHRASVESNGPATGADVNNPNRVFRQAHNWAAPQAGGTFVTFYDNQGNPVYVRTQSDANRVVKTEYSIGGESTGLPKKVIQVENNSQ
jgi:hypothetical protein